MPRYYTVLFVVSRHRSMCVLKCEIEKADVAFSGFFSFPFYFLYRPNYKLGGQGSAKVLS